MRRGSVSATPSLTTSQCELPPNERWSPRGNSVDTDTASRTLQQKVLFTILYRARVETGGKCGRHRAVGRRVGSVSAGALRRRGARWGAVVPGSRICRIGDLGDRDG